MVTVMDDFSRSILAWRLQRDMTSDSLIEAVQDAVDTTGMTEVPVEDTTKLLTDNGPGYVSKVFREYLRLLEIRNILAAPFHPRTRGSTHVAIHGKLERYHQTIRPEVNQCGQQPERYPQDQRVPGLRHAKQLLDSPSSKSGEGQVGGQPHRPYLNQTVQIFVMRSACEVLEQRIARRPLKWEHVPECLRPVAERGTDWQPDDGWTGACHDR